MKRPGLVLLTLSVALGVSACCTKPKSPTDELRSETRQVMMEVRNRMKADGASFQELRDFDKAMVEIDRAMTKIGKQLNVDEAEPAEK